MEPFQFSDWVANECKKVGLIVKKPPKTWDGGADLIIENTAGEIVAIIQCKHAQQGKAPYTAISDLLRACDSYNAHKVKLIAVTNAIQFNAAAEVVAEQHNKIVLIDATNILNVGNTVKSAIDSCDFNAMQ